MHALIDKVLVCLVQLVTKVQLPKCWERQNSTV
jgi:hypothetical protein